MQADIYDQLAHFQEAQERNSKLDDLAKRFFERQYAKYVSPQTLMEIYLTCIAIIEDEEDNRVF